MHIPDGIISTTAALGGYAAAGGLTWLSLRKITQRHENPRAGIPRAALLTAAFFAASLIHIPLPPVSVHLIFSGLMGVMLGWYAVPAVLVGLLLQAVMFQHGGLTTLGVNACLMGLPALFAHWLFQLRRFLGADRPLTNALLAFLAAFLAIAMGTLLAALLLIYTVPAHLDAAAERAAVLALSVAHLPVALLEGVFTAMVVLFLLRVQPALLETDSR